MLVISSDFTGVDEKTLLLFFETSTTFLGASNKFDVLTRKSSYSVLILFAAHKPKKSLILLLLLLWSMVKK